MMMLLDPQTTFEVPSFRPEMAFAPSTEDGVNRRCLSRSEAGTIGSSLYKSDLERAQIIKKASPRPGDLGTDR